MKEGELLKKLSEMGCVFVKHCKKHDRYRQPATGAIDQVPRHPIINDKLAQKVIKNLSR
jgi:predicted RNA binding protein YcfA (HicA-like mRNA interferase family)